MLDLIVAGLMGGAVVTLILLYHGLFWDSNLGGSRNERKR